jgi:hypothetical protein
VTRVYLGTLAAILTARIYWIDGFAAAVLTVAGCLVFCGGVALLSHVPGLVRRGGAPKDLGR